MPTLIERFYDSFSKLDAEGMVDCYHQNVSFTDPAFGTLHGERACNMWRMLCASQKDKNFRIRVSKIKEDDAFGSAHWEAFYTFSKTGRSVHNIIDAEFTFSEGKIITHVDRFDLYRWSKQALGMSGYLLGWSDFFKNRLMSQTQQLLDRFEKNRKSVRD